jgi:hypothetical protein
MAITKRSNLGSPFLLTRSAQRRNRLSGNPQNRAGAFAYPTSLPSNARDLCRKRILVTRVTANARCTEYDRLSSAITETCRWLPHLRLHWIV